MRGTADPQDALYEIRHRQYQTPLTSRYASKEMSYNFSSHKKFSTWRRLWLSLATVEKELGITEITSEALLEMEKSLEDIDFDAAAEEERIRRHDVMAHVHVFGKAAPKAAGIIHLGATSCYVTDNTDLILLRDGLDMLLPKLIRLIRQLKEFALEYADVPTLGYTHFQPAQMTTVGKRTCLWLQELIWDLRNVSRCRGDLRFRGCKGTTGTQASFLELFKGDPDKCVLLDKKVAERHGFTKTYPVTGQTYSRKVDFEVLSALAGFGCTANKIGNDMRLLAHLREVEEPWEKGQIGSSAMAYKRNPMRAERICSIARHLTLLQGDGAMTASTQWLERTLDDSANRRICIPEAFLCADILLSTLLSVTNGLIVNRHTIKMNLQRELPFQSTETLLMKMVQDHSYSRQEAHEKIRQHSLAASKEFKESGRNPLFSLFEKDPYFDRVKDVLEGLKDATMFTGRANSMTQDFISSEVDEAIRQYGAGVEVAGEVETVDV